MPTLGGSSGFLVIPYMLRIAYCVFLSGTQYAIRNSYPQVVKAVAIAQGKKSKRNEFGSCYGELYRTDCCLVGAPTL